MTEKDEALHGLEALYERNEALIDTVYTLVVLKDIKCEDQ